MTCDGAKQSIGNDLVLTRRTRRTRTPPHAHESLVEGEGAAGRQPRSSQSRRCIDSSSPSIVVENPLEMSVSRSASSPAQAQHGTTVDAASHGAAQAQQVADVADVADVAYSKCGRDSSPDHASNVLCRCLGSTHPSIHPSIHPSNGPVWVAS